MSSCAPYSRQQFAKLKRRVSSLEEEVRHEKERNSILEEENRSLKLELGKSKGVVKKLSSMLFGLKSEKLTKGAVSGHPGHGRKFLMKYGQIFLFRNT